MSPSRLLAAARRTLAVAVLLAVGAGVVEVHGAADRHQRGAADGDVFACDLDHGRATHVEAARAVERHDCAACLHRLHSRGGAARDVVVTARSAGGDVVAAAVPAAAPFPPLDRSPSRGPPLA